MQENHRCPDVGWLPILKVVFGFAILLVLAALAMLIALNKVESNTSYGLNIILGGLLTLAGGFASWAFRDEHKNEYRNHDDIQQEKTDH